jgi:uncharacterized protein YjaZ
LTRHSRLAAGALLTCAMSGLACRSTPRTVTTEFYGHYQFSWAERSLITNIAEQTATEVRQYLPNLAPAITLRVRSGTDVIPEFGATAAMVAPDWVVWTVDVERPEGVVAIAARELRSTLFHEFHHLVRGSQGSDLLDHVVTEGLATVFERDFGGVSRPWAEYTNDAPAWLEELLSQPAEANHRAWLFDHPDGRRWVGYRAGAYLVDTAMKNTERTSADFVQTSRAEILRMAGVDRLSVGR